MASFGGVGQIEESLLDAGASVSSGTVYSQVLVLAFALIGGAAFWLAKGYRSLTVGIPPVFGILIYVVWSYLTLFWSESPALSARRLIAFVLVLVGAYGVGTFYYGRLHRGILKMGEHVVIVALLAAATLLVMRLSSVSLAEMLSPDFSLKGTTAVSVFAYHIGYAIVTASALEMDRKKRILTITVLFLSLLFLKARTLIIATILGVAFTRACLAGTGRKRIQWGALLVLCAIALADLSSGGTILLYGVTTGADLINDFVPYLTLGAGEDNITNLSGRAPLWNELLRILPESLWTGHGFGAFWTPTRLDRIYGVTGWPAVNAHNGFLDELLATGLIGLAILLGFLFRCVHRAHRYGRYEKRESVLAMAWVLLFLCFNSMDSILQMLHAHFPPFIVFTSICAVHAHLRRREIVESGGDASAAPAQRIGPLPCSLARFQRSSLTLTYPAGSIQQ